METQRPVGHQLSIPIHIMGVTKRDEVERIFEDKVAENFQDLNF